MRRDQTLVWLLGGVFILYATSLAPSVNWGDGSRIQLDLILGGSNYWFLPELIDAPLDDWPLARLGVAPWDHQLYVVLGRLALAIPVGDPAWRLNLLSALAAVSTVGVVYAVAVRLGAGRGGAALGAVALAVSHTFWFHAVTTEVLALHVLFMMALMGFTLRWWTDGRPADLRWLAFLAGLGLTNHVMLSLTILPVAGFVIVSVLRGPPERRRDLRKQLPFLAALFFAGFLLWAVQFVRVVRVAGLALTLEGIMWFPQSPRPMAAETLLDAAPGIVPYLAFLFYQFTPLGVALGIAGFVRLWRGQRAAAALLAVLYGIHVWFSLGIPISDRYAFYLPSHVIFALWIAVGADALLARLAGITLVRRRVAAAALGFAVALGPPLLYAATPRMLRVRGVEAADLGIPVVPARDGLKYFLNPVKRGDYSAARFGRETLERLAPEALVLAPEPNLEVGLVLRYLQHAERVRPDVLVDPVVMVPRTELSKGLVNRIRALAPCRPVYLVNLPADRAMAAALHQQFEIVTDANLLRLIPRQPPAATACAPPYERMTLSSVIIAALR